MCFVEYVGVGGGQGGVPFFRARLAAGVLAPVAPAAALCASVAGSTETLVAGGRGEAVALAHRRRAEASLAYLRAAGAGERGVWTAPPAARLPSLAPWLNELARVGVTIDAGSGSSGATPVRRLVAWDARQGRQPRCQRSAPSPNTLPPPPPCPHPPSCCQELFGQVRLAALTLRPTPKLGLPAFDLCWAGAVTCDPRRPAATASCGMRFSMQPRTWLGSRAKQGEPEAPLLRLPSMMTAGLHT